MSIVCTFLVGLYGETDPMPIILFRRLYHIYYKRLRLISSSCTRAWSRPESSDEVIGVVEEGLLEENGVKSIRLEGSGCSQEASLLIRGQPSTERDI